VLIEFDDRESDSPYIERVWRSRSRSAGAFLSMADSNIELVISSLPGKHHCDAARPSLTRIER
jgi:hypothetical protein